MRDKSWLWAGMLLALGNVACGSTDDDDSGGSGSACDDPEPRLTGTPTFEPASVPAGQITNVNLTVPVTRSGQRVVVQISQITGTGVTAIGLGDQAYNDAAGCSVTVPLTFHDGVAAGQYFPAITVSAAAADGSAPESVDYSYQSGISTTNYTLITPAPLTIGNSGIPIPFIDVQ